MDSVASIPEASARGEIADLYEDIRATLRVPVTNLVWRHLATVDGALAWVWSCVRPLYIDERLDGPADALRRIGGVAALRCFKRDDLRAAGIGKGDEPVLRAVLANYDRTNPPNLVALMAVQAWLRGERGGGTPRRTTSASPPGVSIVLPPLLTEDDMSPEVRRDARRLEVLGTGQSPRPVVAALPRHLAHWPTFLATCVTALTPLESDLARSIADVHACAREAGRGVAAHLAPAGRPAHPERIEAALGRFTAPDLIANFIPKARTLLAALPD